MFPFELHEPATLDEAIAMLDPDDPTIRPFAGGTALMLMMKAGVFRPSRLISLGKIADDLAAISIQPDGALHIGAMTTLSAIGQSEPVARHVPVLRRTLRTLSNVRVRNMARIGGALAHGDPHMDMPPVLAALGARVVVAGPAGTREIAVEDLYAGYYQTVLAPNELIKTVIVPAPAGRRSAYLKITTRSADDWPALGIAVSLRSDGDAVVESSIVISAATEKVTRLANTQQILRNAPLTDKTLRDAGDAAVAESSLVADARGSLGYKQDLLRVHIGRAIRMAHSKDAA